MKPKAEYKVRYERDAESGWWVASVVGLEGCITQGRTIEQSRERIREALQAWFDLPKPYAGEIVDDIDLPAKAIHDVVAALDSKAVLEAAAARNSETLRVAIRTLRKLGLGLSDAGELVGVSRQRAHQLLAKPVFAAQSAPKKRRTAQAKARDEVRK